ncbi:MAG TPA: T9SS type A sorting domain-containing protein [Chitinophagales bacterium]|nr:T9SS type A sorting domain-containing protein [Chitinophagales bacterium]
MKKIIQSENVSLNVFDASGRLVSTLANKVFNAGENELVWNAADVNAGLYFLKMESENYSETIKLSLVK